MIKEFVCRVDTDGYRLQVTVRATLVSEAETLARQVAVERMKRIHGIERREDQFEVTAFKEKCL